MIKKIAKVCKENNIKLIVYTSPYYNTYIDMIVTEKGMKILSDVVDSIKSEYPQTVYNNFMGDTSFLDLDYADAHHLNLGEAKKLISSLMNLIQEKIANNEIYKNKI